MQMRSSVNSLYEGPMANEVVVEASCTLLPSRAMIGSWC